MKNVYFLAFVRKPKSNARLKSERPLFRNLQKISKLELTILSHPSNGHISPNRKLSSVMTGMIIGRREKTLEWLTSKVNDLKYSGSL